MHSNDVLQMTDTHRLSPQTTTSSSGYHSDLSSTNQSPQSIHENPIESIIQKKTNKNFSRISSFIRKQYEKAKLRFLSSKQRPSSPITTFSKATSTTALTNVSENIPIKPPRSSFIEPVKSIYVPPLDNKQQKISLNQKSISHPLSHRLSSCSQSNNNSHSYRRLIARSNYENISTEYLPTYSIKSRYSQDYYPYKYLNKNYNYNRSIYVPLSDFVSTRNSAFKPIKSFRQPVHDLFEQIPSSDDPCDLEVAQYFHQTPQWSNPNYFDIYKNDISLVSTKKNYSGTLC